MEMLGAGMLWTQVLEAASKQRGNPRPPGGTAAGLVLAEWTDSPSRVSGTARRQHVLSAAVAVMIQVSKNSSPLT